MPVEVKRFDAVIFDLYGTLVPSMRDDSYLVSLGQTAIAVGAEETDFIRVWREEDTLEGRMTGRFATKADCVRHVCERLGLEPSEEAIETAARIRAEYGRWLLQPRPDAIATLSKLRAGGLKLALMSACSADTPILWPQTPLAPHLDEAVFSCQVNLNKPDPEFYRLICDRLGVLPYRCLYVGDGAYDELAGAERVGMEAVLLCPPEEEDIILARESTKNWHGPRISRLSDILPIAGLNPDSIIGRRAKRDL